MYENQSNKYECLDEILDNFSPDELAEYLIMNNFEYADVLEFNLDVLLRHDKVLDHPKQTYIRYKK